jgi:hypothetical protein
VNLVKEYLDNINTTLQALVDTGEEELFVGKTNGLGQTLPLTAGISPCVPKWAHGCYD